MGLRFNNRAITNLVLVAIISVVVAVVLFSIGISLLKSARYNEDVNACRLSVLGRAVTMKVTRGATPPIKLDCRSHNLKITKEGITRDDEPFHKAMGLEFSESNYQSLDEQDAENKIKLAVAEEMRWCWYKMLAGTQDPFGDYDGSRRCVTCAVVEFDKEIKNRYPEMEFGLFLRDTVMQGSDLTYLEYLSKDAVAEDEQDLKNLKIVPSETYAVAYVSDRNGDTWKLIGSATGCALAGASTFFTYGLTAAGTATVCGSFFVLAGKTYIERGQPKYLATTLVPFSAISQECGQFK